MNIAIRLSPPDTGIDMCGSDIAARKCRSILLLTWGPTDVFKPTSIGYEMT